MVGGRWWTSALPISVMSNFPRFKVKFHKKLKRNGKLPPTTTNLTAWAAASIKHRVVFFFFFSKKIIVKTIWLKAKDYWKLQSDWQLALKIPPTTFISIVLLVAFSSCSHTPKLDVNFYFPKTKREALNSIWFNFFLIKGEVKRTVEMDDAAVLMLGKRIPEQEVR